MRRLVVLALCVLAVGCGRSEPELTQEQKDALQAMGEMQSKAKASPAPDPDPLGLNAARKQADAHDRGWKLPGAFDAAGTVAQSDRLRIEAVDVRRQSVLGDEQLVVIWKVKNLTANEKIDYALPLEEYPTLHVADEFGNEYPPVWYDFDEDELPEDYRHDPASLYPGAETTDATVSDPPVEGAKELFVWFRDEQDDAEPAYAFKLAIPAKR